MKIAMLLAAVTAWLAWSTPLAAANVRNHAIVQEGETSIEVIVDEASGPDARERKGVIVLLPSSQRGSEDFDTVAELLAQAGYRVLRPQPRGIGASRGPLEGMSLHTLAGDVALAIRLLGQGRAVVVGHAYGHYVARVMAQDYPALVRGVVVAAAAAKGRLPAQLSAALDTAADQRNSTAQRIAALRDAFFYGPFVSQSWLEGWHPELASAYRQASRTTPQSTWWPYSTVPILDLQAQHDPWRPAATRDELRDALPGMVEVRVIPDASHALFPEQPQAVAREIVDWADRLAR
ncbi:alpha/beta fold hydrolase [Herbaspirillum frisingense]|uniref:alpha/beta fold hydrolase n=1 Tax=Herbaspirillum frisingense TaxID=92645 RepID=UPI001F1A3E21|nr:alpha/beta hydrolase [Herbaspirillum frisingense]UIN22291.1 alpha/beta hydrolase [Herbaspirillum frisingense]